MAIQTMKRKKKYRKRVHVNPEHVKAGQCYWCVVSKQLVIVRIVCPLSFAYKWDARNLKTGRVVKLTANRLRYRVEHDELLLHERMWQRQRSVKQRAYRPRIERTETERQAIKEQRHEAAERKAAKDKARIEAHHVRLDAAIERDKQRRIRNETLDQT